MMVELVGFAPDAIPTLPGVMTDCENIIPFERGFRAAPTAQTVGLPALAAQCRGAGVVRDLSGGLRLLAGTAAKLYQSSGTTWTDVSASTAGYSLADDDRWSFAQFGNTTMAATPTKRIQRSPSSTFAEVTAAPKAHILVSATNFVIAFHCDETTYGEQPDRWWCCALYDETDWTPSIATQATTGRILDGQGGFKAAQRLGDDVVAYKERGVFVGRYSGPPVVWAWTPVSEDVGCVGPEAVANTSIGHVFVATDNFYLFDGTRPVPLASGTVRQWWLDNSSSQYRFRTKLLWDRFNNLVWIYFPSSSSTGACDKCMVFHVLRRQWGLANISAEAVVTYVTSGSITYDGGSDSITTYDTGPTLTFDSVQWLAEAEAPAIFSTTHQIQTLNGEPDSSSFTTGDVGDALVATMCNGARLLTSKAGLVADATGFSRETAGGTLKRRTTASLNDGAFDLRQTARFHRVRLDMSGDFRFSALDLDLKPAGRR